MDRLPVILVVHNLGEARQYRSRFPSRNLVSMHLNPIQRLEGLRLEQAFYTDYAREHPKWDDVFDRLYQNFLITKEYGKNPIGRIRNIEFIKEHEYP